MNSKQRKTVDERIAKEKQAFLEALAKQPIISVACERSGVSKATLHRWKAEDKEFAENVGKAMREGNNLISDIAKAQLASLIKDKNFQAIKFWLMSIDPDFKPTLEIEGEVTVVKELSPETQEKLKKALGLVAELLTKNYPQNNEHEQHLSQLGNHGV